MESASTATRHTVTPSVAPRRLGTNRLSRRRRLGSVAFVALGGALGTPARVAVGYLVPPDSFHLWDTLIVNVAGCLVLGVVTTFLVERSGPTRHFGPFLATGFCGSFTTFSTYAVAVDLELRSGDVAAGLGYAVASLVLGLAALCAGIALARRLTRDSVTTSGPDDRRSR